MLALPNEIHFWSTEDNILVKPTDYGTYKYYLKKDGCDVYVQSKKLFCERRGLTWHITNKRPAKLKDKLKDFEDLLLQSNIVNVFWEDSKLQLLLSKGHVVNIAVNFRTGDINSIRINKQLVHRIQPDAICDGIISGNQLICICQDGRLLGIGPQWKDGWTFECGNKRSLSHHKEWLAVWGKAGAEHPQPWSPMAKDHERANLNLLYVSPRGPELLAYKKTDGEPIFIAVSKTCSRSVISVEQKVNQRGAVSVEVITLELVGNTLKRVLVTLVPLQTQVSCCVLSDNEERLLLGCIDGSVAVLNRNTGSTRTSRASFIPTFAVWHRSGALMALANDKGQMQYFDAALSCVHSYLTNEDSIPSAISDFSGYFNRQATVEGVFWGPNCMLVAFEHGPVLFSKQNFEAPLDFVTLSEKYLALGKVEMAISLLLSWEFNQQSFMVLQKVCEYLMKLPLTTANAKLLQDALGSFHSPAAPIATAVRHKFGSKVQSLTRRYFHQLVRAKMYETAFLLAVDLGHHDLFMDLHYVAVKIGETEMAAAARAQASALLSRCSSDASDCSRSSCSQCSVTGSSSCSEEESLNDNNSEAQDLYNYTAATSADNTSNNDNFLTTNFNTATPKTYVNNTPSATSSVPPVPPIPNVDLPKINPPPPPRVAYVKPPVVPTLSFNKTQVTGGVLAPPLPYVPFGLSNATTTTNLGSNVAGGFLGCETGVGFGNACAPNFGRTFSMPSIVHTSASFAPFKSNFITTQPYQNRFMGTYPETPYMFSAHSSSNLTNNTIKYSPIGHAIPPVIPPPMVSISSSSSLAPIATLSSTLTSSCTTTSTITAKKQQAKVKFSDTVTAFIVPEVKRPPRPAPPAHLTDPQKELADSLPLCHPNEDYLKDFAPVKKAPQEAGQVGGSQPQSKIKVVHFGVV